LIGAATRDPHVAPNEIIGGPSATATMAGMDRNELIAFTRQIGLAVVATAGPDGAPQAALVGVAATDEGELVFDTSRASRKVANLIRNARVALVIGGWQDEVTLQCEGVADILDGDELLRCRPFYFDQYPDGLERAKHPDIVYVRARPQWVRCADFRPESFGFSEAVLA
jgi:Pyridoxamine 5''-phosphate oxidase.